MKVLELFAGTRSIGKAFEARGHQVYSVDWDDQFDGIDFCGDVMDLAPSDIIRDFGYPDVIWASPDCTSYSVAAISRHRRKDAITGNLNPYSDYAKVCDQVNLYTHNIIMALMPRLWFIENPRGGMRKMDFMRGLPRYTVTYCQYELDRPASERRMKPTDIWTNHPEPNFLPMCHNGDPCHARAPRSATLRKMKAAGADMSHIGGTQYGMRGARERSVIPAQLCEHIVDISEQYVLAKEDRYEQVNHEQRQGVLPLRYSARPS